MLIKQKLLIYNWVVNYVCHTYVYTQRYSSRTKKKQASNFSLISWVYFSHAHAAALVE